MDRTQYGRDPTDTYRPYDLIIKKKPAPGYALLADLQNTMKHSPTSPTQPQPAPHHINGPPSPHRHPPYHHHQNGNHQMYQTEEVRTEQVTSGMGEVKKTTSSLNNNLSELETLLSDLNQSRLSGFKEHSTTMNGGRPGMDALLDELDCVEPPLGSVEHTRTVHKEFRTTTETLAPPAPAPAPAPAPEASLRPPPPPQPSASPATKELDDLMASLSEFKVMDEPGRKSLHHHRQQEGNTSTATTTTVNASSLQSQVDSTYAKPLKPSKPSSPPPPAATAAAPRPDNQLDCMLGSLTTHMSEQGVNTTQKGCCCACNKPIVGQVITALGRTWHSEHFTCAHCKEELGTRNFFEREGKPYCEKDYHNLFSPRCAYCDEPILDKCVTALDKTWHPLHFFCASCGNPFGDDGFHERDGKPYCREDYHNMFAPKCGGCNSPITENYISALNTQWHPECFVCRDCKESMRKKQYYAVDNKPVCPACMGVSDDDDDDE